MICKYHSSTAVIAIGFFCLRFQPTKRMVVQKKKYLSVRETQMERLFKEPQKYIYIHCYC